MKEPEKIGRLKLHIHKDKEEAVGHAGLDLSDFLEEHKDKDLLFLVSGGSSFSMLEGIPKYVLGKNITISVLDERYDQTNENNNFSQLKKTKFYERAKHAGCHFIDTSVKEGQTQEELADFFEESLRKWLKEHIDGKIIATAGVGADAHTAGIMPF